MISLLAPWALLGLPLVGVPLILHLIQRREPPTVTFPAVRYLVQVTEEHKRRLRLRHWLLLLLRTLLILALVVAAAGPSAPLGDSLSHAPSALVVVLDDSPSSGAVVAGTSRLVDLRAAARRVLERATPADALWLITSDGVARRGSPEELLRRVDSVAPTSRRIALGEALDLAGQVLGTDSRPGGIVLITDLQATALSPARVTVPLVVAHPTDDPPTNEGVVRLDPGPQPWTPEGGDATVVLGGDSSVAAPVSVTLADRPGRQAVIPGGGTAAFFLPGVLPGWWTVRASKAADELRADDDRLALVRVAPVARVAWETGDRYLDAALSVLESAGRLQRGGELSVGTLGRGPSVVFPPADPAQLGALNRALERRGVGWRFGAEVAAPGITDSNGVVGRETVTRRLALEPLRASASAGVIASVGGAPWLVRAGDVVLIGSRLEPGWTGLPLRAPFVPFLDRVVNRLARGEVAMLEAAPGDPVLVPDLVTEVAQGDRRWPVEGGAAFRPPTTGVYYLREGRDTVGGIVANIDPRESRLSPATDGAVRALWPGARVVGLAGAPGAAFAGAGRASLVGPLLWLALLLGAGEVVLASWRRGPR